MKNLSSFAIKIIRVKDSTALSIWKSYLSRSWFLQIHQDTRMSKCHDQLLCKFLHFGKGWMYTNSLSDAKEINNGILYISANTVIYNL